MKIPKKYSLKLLWLLPVAVLAAVPFLPDLVNSSTYVTQPVGYVGSPVASVYQLQNFGSTATAAQIQAQAVFTIDYSTSDWSGNLNSFPIDGSGRVSTTGSWSGGAAAQINAQNESLAGVWNATGRYIVTRNASAGIPFVWGSLTAAQKTALDSASVSASSSPVLNYVRGDGSNEVPNGNSYRARATVLGDIIHSTPKYWDDGTNTTVFVGANDGMLHAFNAVTGAERFAYIPSVLIPKLPLLKVNPYAHKYFVDGQLAARKYNTQSILVGGLGGGGMGLYGLDITAVPTSETDAATKILWEITNASAGFANLGHTYGTPVLTILPNGTNALVVSNGYNNGCTNACNSGANSAGNGHATLLIINPVTGAKLGEMDTGSGSTTSPNGLSSPTLVDTNADGIKDTAYAGDLNGNLWKFDLSDLTSTPTILYTTNPARPITMAPAFKQHPYGGRIVTFATGQNYTTADNTDTSTNYAYGIWDRPSAYAANAALLDQTLTERSYTFTPASPVGASPQTLRVRTVTSLQPNWTAGSTNNMGWRTTLPSGGERVLGDGAIISTDSAFTFLSTNPTANTTSQPPGENWEIHLDALTGGDRGVINFDLNQDGLYTSADQVSVTTGSVTSLYSPVAIYFGGGIRSQLTAFADANGYNVYQANFDKNSAPTIPPNSGVANGHFDEDIYFGSLSAATQATATITVGTTGQTSSYPATLGNITVNGVVVVPALTTADIPDGTAATNNATTINSKVTGGFTATRRGSVITISAPSGVIYNGNTIDIADGTSQMLVPAAAAIPAVSALATVNPTGFISFGGLVNSTTNSTGTVSISRSLTSGSNTILVGSLVASNANPLTIGNSKTPAQVASVVAGSIGTGGVIQAYVGGNSITAACAIKTSNVVCLVDTSTTVTNGKAVTFGTLNNFGGVTVSATSTTGGVIAVNGSPGVAAVVKSGWTNFKPALTTTVFSGGADGITTGDNCTNCQYDTHVHQYDKKYNVTGVNYLNPSNIAFNLNRAISSSTQFKVLAQNQYLSPALKVHIGNPSYLYNVNAGYISIKNFVTSTTLSLASLPTYTLSNVGSFAINMPVDALTPKDWWGNGDVRAGLHPSSPGCLFVSNGVTDGNMYQPVIPPANGVNGPGVNGWSSSSTPATSTGARHGGALVIQIIRANTPDSEIEQNVPGRPEYGWRVKSAFYAKEVLAEYNTFWHHPNNICYGNTGWTKNPGADNGTSTPIATAPGSTDPQIGSLGIPTPGTTINTLTNADGSVTTTTTTIVVNANGTVTVTTTVSNSSGGSTTTTVTNGITTGGVATGTTVNTNGSRGNKASLGRVSWRELFQ